MILGRVVGLQPSPTNVACVMMTDEWLDRDEWVFWLAEREASRLDDRMAEANAAHSIGAASPAGPHCLDRHLTLCFRELPMFVRFRTVIL